MNDRNVNRLNMVNACLRLAESPEHRPVWDGKDPVAFTADFAALKAAAAETDVLAAQLGSIAAGAADAKAVAETALEDAAFLVATALRSFYKKTADSEGLRKVNFAKSYLQRLRDAQLVADARAIHAAAQSLATNSEAQARGVTASSIATLGAAIDVFDGLLSKPRTNLVNRNTLVRELATRVADHLEAIADLDDLVLQFGATPAGQRFAEAWQGARVIVDAGAGQAKEEPMVVPATASAAAAA